MRRLLDVGAVAAEEVAGDVAGGDADQARGGDEHMGEILADAVARGGGLLGAGVGPVASVSKRIVS